MIRNHFPVSRFSTSIVPAPWTTRKAHGPYRVGTTEGGRGSVLLHQIGARPREDEGMMGSFGGKRRPGFVGFRGNQRGRENRTRLNPPAFSAETGEEGRARNRAQWSDTGQGIPWQKRADKRRRGASRMIASGVCVLMAKALAFLPGFRKSKRKESPYASTQFLLTYGTKQGQKNHQ